MVTWAGGMVRGDRCRNGHLFQLRCLARSFLDWGRKVTEHLAKEIRNIKILVWIGGVFLGIIIAIIVSCLIYDRSPIYKFENGEIGPNPAKPGEMVTVTWQVRQLRNGCEGIVLRQVIAGGRIWDVGTIRKMGADIPKLGGQFMLPVAAAEGPAVYRVRPQRWCNPIQRIFWPMTDGPEPLFFTIER